MDEGLKKPALQLARTATSRIVGSRRQRPFLETWPFIPCSTSRQAAGGVLAIAMSHVQITNGLLANPIDY
jgi:hypothetical protein